MSESFTIWHCALFAQWDHTPVARLGKKSKVTDLKVDMRGLRYIAAMALAPGYCTGNVLHTSLALYGLLRGLWSKTFGSVFRRFLPRMEWDSGAVPLLACSFRFFRSGDGKSRSLIATSLLTAFPSATRHESRSLGGMDSSNYLHAGGGYGLGVEHKNDLEEPRPSKLMVRLDAEIAWFSRARKLAWT